MKNAFFVYLCFFLFQIQAMGSNPYKWKPIDPSFDSLGKQLEQINYKSNERMDSYPLVTRMYQIAKLKNNTNLEVRALYWDAWLLFESDTDKTEELINKAFAKIDSVNYGYDHARISFVKGMILAKQNSYPQAYRTFKTQERFFKDIKDYYNLGYTYISIGSIMKRIGEYKEAYKYYEQADKVFEKGRFGTEQIKNQHNIGVVQFHLGYPPKAIKTLIGLLENEVTQKDLAFQIDVLTSLYYVSQTLPNKEKYARAAYKASKLINNKTSRTYALINMGALYIYKNENDSALYYFLKAHQTAKVNKDAYSFIHTLYGLSELYARKNESDSAYQTLKRYLRYKEETTGYAKSTEINRLEVRTAIEQYEKELKQADENVRRHKRITLIIAFSITFAALLVCYILWILRKKEKISKLLKETENRVLNERLQKEQLQNEQFQLKIDLKNRELTSNSMIMAEKNQVLKDLLNQIEDLAGKGHLPHPQDHLLKKQIKSHLVSEDEWTFFKIHFEEVHPNFFTKLSEDNPALSENELRLCAYVRIGMSNKQIAQMLSVLPETINTSRYRIRKKMQLEQEESLEDYLRGI